MLSYPLPVVEDLDGDNVIIKIDLGTAKTFSTVMKGTTIMCLPKAINVGKH